jgi:hypothetical protein
MPILGIIASQGRIPSTSYESIATFTLASNTASVEFTSIPSTYKHLQIRGFAKMDSTASGGDEGFKITYNNDTGSNYSSHFVYGVGNGQAYQAVIPNTTYMIPYGLPYNGSGNIAWGGFVMDILDYADTNKTKTMKSLSGWSYSGSGDIVNCSGVWNSTAAINSIKFGIVNGTFKYRADTKFALYGIKG